jgi:hypothetical protein
MTPEEYFAKARASRRAANTVQRVTADPSPYDYQWLNPEARNDGGIRHAWRTSHQGAWREIARAVYLRKWQDGMFAAQRAGMMR